MGPALITCAEEEVNHLTTLVMNNCIRKYVDDMEDVNLLNIQRNSNNEIERIQYDTKILNQTRTEITTMLENDLENLVQGNIEELELNLNQLSNEYYKNNHYGILFFISIGSATGNSFLANLGPKIPLNLQSISDVTTNIEPKITEYGLNNALVAINIKLSATMIIQMPFLSKKVTVENTIPLNLEIIQGTIPNYYLNGDIK